MSTQTFLAVNDGRLAAAIDKAQRRVLFAAPGLGEMAGRALVDAASRLPTAAIVILDADADSCRIGYGDAEPLLMIQEAADCGKVALRRQHGLRLGVLVADDEILIWSPTPRSVERERDEEPNGIALQGPAVEICSRAMGEGRSDSSEAEIGRNELGADEVTATVEELRKNPPAPFDLAQKARVFSARFQFVEFELRGAEWTERRLKLSSFLMNADLPESLRDLLDTQIRPFQGKGDVSFEVPCLVRGKPAYTAEGERMFVPATQAEILRAWSDIRDGYLRQVKGFGWLIRRDDLAEFTNDVASFEETLRAWVDGFVEAIRADEATLVKEVTQAVASRTSRAAQRQLFEELDLEQEVRKGLDRLRVIEPRVRIVLKNVAWESTRDDEFMEALRQALPEEDLEGWFEEFTVARERPMVKGSHDRA
ncbi:MAG: hypothetical protein R2745_20225 [Vicinamibacterales bacterium]